MRRRHEYEAGIAARQMSAENTRETIKMISRGLKQMYGEKQTVSAVEQIYEIIRALGSPRDAARALAGAHVMLFEAEGIRTEEDARVRLAQSTQAILEVWRERQATTSDHG